MLSLAESTVGEIARIIYDNQTFRGLVSYVNTGIRNQSRGIKCAPTVKSKIKTSTELKIAHKHTNIAGL